MFKKAKREKAKIKIALIGPSGSGKTYSALRLASGLVGEEGKIALIDTESRRSTYYADEFSFDIEELEAPYSPERYIEIIDSAEKAGYDCLIIDSATHEWSGVGGCLDIHSKMPGNSYTNWAKVTPRHNKFIEKVLRCDMHVISTIRGKDQYVLEQDDRGKNIPKKVGMGGVQRDGIEYEYTCTFMLDIDNHIATTQKDNTHLFEGDYEVLTEQHGQKLAEWADSGIKPVKKIDKQTVAAIGSFAKYDENIKQYILDKLKDKGYSESTDLYKLTQEEGKNLLKEIEMTVMQEDDSQDIADRVSKGLEMDNGD